MVLIGRVVQIVQALEPDHSDSPEEIEIDFQRLRPITLRALEEMANGNLDPIPKLPPGINIDQIHLFNQFQRNSGGAAAQNIYARGSPTTASGMRGGMPARVQGVPQRATNGQQ